LFQAFPGMFFHSDRRSQHQTNVAIHDKVSNPSRDVFPFWLGISWEGSITIIGEFQTLPGMFFHSDKVVPCVHVGRPAIVSNPSRDVFPFWHHHKFQKISSYKGFKPFQGCFSILTNQEGWSGGKDYVFQTLPGMFFHSDYFKIFHMDHLLKKVSNPSRDVFPFWQQLLPKKLLLRAEVSNPSRDVFPFWPLALQINKAEAARLFQTLPGMFFHSDCTRSNNTDYMLQMVSNPSRDVFPFWRFPLLWSEAERKGFKPFQGCFSILTQIWLKTLERMMEGVSNPSRDVFPFWPGR